MDFPRAYFVLVLLFGSYLALQVYLFLRLRNYLRGRFHERTCNRLVLAAVCFFFFCTLYPLIWRVIFGFWVQEPLVVMVRGFLAVWAFGSSGLALVLLGSDFFHRARRVLTSRAGVSPNLERRAFLQMGVGLAAAAPFFVSGYGVVLGRRRFQVEHFDLPLDGLSSALDHLSVVHLTDIHAGPFMPAEELAEYVEAANRLKPDLIALTGDFVSTRVDEAGTCAAALEGLKARYGIFACMGNHDVYAEAEEELTRLFEARGIRVLRNDAVSLRVGNTALNVLGIDDLRKSDPNLSQTLRLAQREPGEVRLLLSHRPEIFPEASRKGIELVLAGHYHGGQVKLGTGPESLSVARLVTPYADGLFHLPRRSVSSAPNAKGSVLFVGRGVGITGLPIRINCPPQIAHLTFRKA